MNGRPPEVLATLPAVVLLQEHILAVCPLHDLHGLVTVLIIQSCVRRDEGKERKENLRPKRKEVYHLPEKSGD